MKNILVLGAGKSATCLIDYLVKESAANDWSLTVADHDLQLAASKTGNASCAKPVALDVKSDTERNRLIAQSDVVISLLPPSLHHLAANSCLQLRKHLLTASYIDSHLESLRQDIQDRGLLFLCETGLDPGIDHMSAMHFIDRIRKSGGSVHSFRSYCGGLVAPESDNNPWRYKISWNPRNIVMAGKAGAVYRENNQLHNSAYETLFDANRVINFPELGFLAWYPNRDSLSYAPLYGLENVHTFIRATLRYPEFCFGWKNIIDLKLTDETVQYETDGMTLQQFFHEHFTKYGFSDWIEKQLTARFVQTKQLLEKLQQLLEAEQDAGAEERKELQDFMMVDDDGQLMDVNLDTIKTQAAATVAGQMHEANLSMKQLFYLGMDDTTTVINNGSCSAADVLQFALENKLVLEPGDKDMIVMLHDIGFERAGKQYRSDSRLVVTGDDPVRTAMAKTVGLPLGIAAKLVMQGKITSTGLHIPVIPDIYLPILQELAQHGISFLETEEEC